VRFNETKLKIKPMRALKLAICMTGNGLIATCFVGLLIAGTGRAHGLDPGKRLTQYRHNVWRVQDGFFTGAPSWVSQTADGYLWVVTWSGVFRFDGVRFVPWSPPASDSSHIHLFAPAKSGGFWINDGLGLSHIRGNRIVSHINLGAPAGQMVEEEDGSLWVTTFYRAGSPGLLCHVTDREVRCFGKADGLPIQIANAILSDGIGGILDRERHKSGPLESRSIGNLRTSGNEVKVW
jgi:ligand-binding sensor domain-containing protein